MKTPLPLLCRSSRSQTPRKERGEKLNTCAHWSQSPALDEISKLCSVLGLGFQQMFHFLEQHQVLIVVFMYHNVDFLERIFQFHFAAAQLLHKLSIGR